MSRFPKFNFDQSFEDVDADGRLIVEVEPVYSQFERDQAFEEGRRQGLSEGIQEIKQQTAHQTCLMLEKLEQKIMALQNHENQMQEQMLDMCCAISYKIAEKILPLYLKDHQLTEIDLFVRTTLKEKMKSPSLCVTLHPQTLAELQEQDKKMPEMVVFQEDDQMGQDDCIIAWQDGSAERNLNRLWEEIGVVFQAEESE